jgi:hypothetical protein
METKSSLPHSQMSATCPYTKPIIIIIIIIIITIIATKRKVAGSTPASISGFFIDIKSFRSHYGPGVDSASNRNEYQEHYLGVKAAGA